MKTEYVAPLASLWRDMTQGDIAGAWSIVVANPAIGAVLIAVLWLALWRVSDWFSTH